MTTPQPVAGAVAHPAGMTGGPRPGGGRWGLALVLTAVLLGALAAGATLLTTPTQPEALRFVPSGSAIVVELRPDLPGDQRTALGSFLAHFPGFGDQSSAASRIDDALDMLVVRATDGKRHYVGDLKPYATGPIYLAIPGVGTTAAGGASTRMLAVLTTDGAGGCQPLEDGRTVTVERYGDVDLRVPSDTGATGTVPACAVSGGFVLLGDVDSIKAALDARSQGRSVTGDPAYVSAVRSLTGDHVATVFVDGHQAAALASAMPRPSTFPLPSGAPQVSLGSAQPLLGMGNDLPAWLAIGVRVTAGAAIVDGFMPDQRSTVLAQASGSTGRTPAPEAISAIAPALPASTIAVAELHQAGPLLEGFLARSGASASAGATASPAPNASQNLAQLQAALGFLGGSDALLGPLDQAAVVVISQADKLGGGVVIQTADTASARTRLDQLASLLALAGGGVQDYHGDRIVTVPLAGIVRSAGSTLPSTATTSLPAGATLAIAVHQSLIVAGIGDVFVKAVIDTTAGSSLAGLSAYRSAIDLAGSPGFAQAYVDMPGFLSAIRPMVPAANLQAFDQEVSSWLKPIGSIAMGATSAGGIVHGRLVVITP